MIDTTLAWATFHTVDLDTLTIYIFEAGYDNVSGIRYSKDGQEFDLIFKGTHYELRTLPKR